MNRPVSIIHITKAQLCLAVQTYLNDHVFREPIFVTKVTKAEYGDNADIELGDPAPVADTQEQP